MRPLILCLAIAAHTNSVLASDCFLETTMGTISWEHGTFIPVNGATTTEQWLCIGGQVYRPYLRSRSADNASVQEHPLDCSHYQSNYYRHHENQIPEKCKSSDQKAREWSDTYGHNL